MKELNPRANTYSQNKMRTEINSIYNELKECIKDTARRIGDLLLNVIEEYGVKDKIDYVVADNGNNREERSRKTWKKKVMIVQVKLSLPMTTLKVMLDRSQ